MTVAIPVLMTGITVTILAALLLQKSQIAALAGPFPARQIAYNMRLYHRSAVAAKIANPSALGVLVVTPPAFLTDWRFTACADNNAVITYATGLDSAQSRDVATELLRQSVVPPELFLISEPPPIGGFAPAIGLSAGGVVNNGFAALAPACALPNGVAAMQTQVMP